jgi:hypothetical protein
VAPELVTLQHAGRWEALLRGFPPEKLDVYFSPGYHRAVALDEGAEALLFAYEESSERLVYPFLLRRIDAVGERAIPGGHHDIESAYGFTGPVSTTEDGGFLRAAWAAFDEWSRGQRVVAEFVRFNPLLGNHVSRAPAMDLTKVRDHVVLDLTPGEEAVARGYAKANRSTIRKAERGGLTCRIGGVQEYLGRFLELYRVTMDRNRAAPGYYFSRAHLETLAEDVPSFACAAARGREVLAVSLFLLGPRRVHYHLSGCSAAGLRAAANNLVLHCAVREACSRGLRLFHFGGGRTGAANDPLLRFKAGFSRGRLPAYVGRRVHSPEVYAELCELRRRQVPSVPGGYFLAYRYEPRVEARPLPS